MSAAGQAAFARRSKDRSAIYAYEQRASAKLTPAETRLFKAQGQAWEYFSKLAPSYRQKALYWITSARKPETRMTRLARIIAASAAGKKV